MLATKPTCTTRSQLRLLPINRVRTGTSTLSAAGAQAHLKAYAKDTQLKKPIVARSTPASRSHTDKLENTNKIGKPEAKPRKNNRITAGCR